MEEHIAYDKEVQEMYHQCRVMLEMQGKVINEADRAVIRRIVAENRRRAKAVAAPQLQIYAQNYNILRLAPETPLDLAEKKEK